MPATGYQLRKRKREIFYGKSRAPWLPLKPQRHSGTNKTKANAPDDHEAASSTIANAIGDDSSLANFHEPHSEAQYPSSAPTVPLKRARSETIQNDDCEEAIDDGLPIPLQKRRMIREPLPTYSPAPSPPPQSAGKARSELSPATEAAIREMPNEIKKSIKTLKMIRRYVNGLLDFKAILDYRQVELDQKLEEIARREVHEIDLGP